MALVCNPYVKTYEGLAASRSTKELEKDLFGRLAVLSKEQRIRADFRKWRRCVIVELLKRGVLTKDPGLGPPERG